VGFGAGGGNRSIISGGSGWSTKGQRNRRKNETKVVDLKIEVKSKGKRRKRRRMRLRNQIEKNVSELLEQKDALKKLVSPPPL